MTNEEFEDRKEMLFTLMHIFNTGTEEGAMVHLKYYFVQHLIHEYADMLSELRKLTEETTKTPVTEDIDPNFSKPVYREDIGL
jgi:hypothetical protein